MIGQVHEALGDSAVWRNVDDNAAPAIQYLDRLAGMIEPAKRRSFELLRLRPGHSVLEVGCGTGDDARLIAAEVGPTGRVIGLDVSHELIAEAERRSVALGLAVRFEVGDAQALRFATGSFDGARIDRVLQHLLDPVQAVREMARVVRPKGRLAALEPNWETLSVASCDPDISRTVTRHRAEHSVAHGAIGRDLKQLLVAAGCREVTAELQSFTFDDLAVADHMLSLGQTLEDMKAHGLISPAAAEAWWRDLEERDRSGTFYAAMSATIAGATVMS